MSKVGMWVGSSVKLKIHLDILLVCYCRLMENKTDHLKWKKKKTYNKTLFGGDGGGVILVNFTATTDATSIR